MDSEIVSLAIEWEGAFVEARTIGGLIENTRKLLACSAKGMVVPTIEWGEKRAVFHFALMPPVRNDKSHVGFDAGLEVGGTAHRKVKP
jgi:hypothetical protein